MATGEHNTARKVRVSARELEFLTSHNVNANRVLMTEGMNSAQVRALMSDTNYLVAAGTAPCRSGHRLKTRTGHCPQCQPDALAISRRWVESGFLYVAYSGALNAVKVGLAESSIEKRQASLNRTNYAAASDWQIFYYLEAEQIGRLENTAHQGLARYKRLAFYEKNGDYVEAKELFSCSLEVAVSTIEAACGLRLTRAAATSHAQNLESISSDPEVILDAVLQYVNTNSVPHFNRGLIFGMKKNVENGNKLTEKQVEALLNIAKGWKIM
jgi:hypothetical protein